MARNNKMFVKVVIWVVVAMMVLTVIAAVLTPLA